MIRANHNIIVESSVVYRAATLLRLEVFYIMNLIQKIVENVVVLRKG